MKLALCQITVTDDKTQNLARAKDALRRAADKGAVLAILPEMFSIAYVPKLFRAAAEPCPGGACANLLSETAKEAGLFIIGGSIPELHGERLFNTSMSFAPDGTYLGKYRKAHLFDIDIPGTFRFMESETIAPGDGYPLMLDAPIKTGVAICYDIRFPEWARLMMQEGADLLTLPAAFSRSTGPRHWELLLRARALDNQLFVAAVSPAQSPSAYGHSLVATPDGAVLYACGTEEEVAVVDLDLGMLQELRDSIPVRRNRRTDLYRLTRTD